MPRAKQVASQWSQRRSANGASSKADRYVRQRIMKVAKAVAPWPPQAMSSRRLDGRIRCGPCGTWIEQSTSSQCEVCWSEHDQAEATVGAYQTAVALVPNRVRHQLARYKCSDSSSNVHLIFPYVLVIEVSTSKQSRLT